MEKSAWRKVSNEGSAGKAPIFESESLYFCLILNILFVENIQIFFKIYFNKEDR